MNPSTGTFISMDSYPGSVYDPVSLHKYLYANANPVMYTDPSGYATDKSLAETAVTQGGILIISAGMLFAGQVALNIFSNLRKNMADTVMSLPCSVSVTDWKNVVLGCPAHEFDTKWMITIPVALTSWQLFEAIYATEEDTGNIPGVPAEEQEEKDKVESIPAEEQSGTRIYQNKGKSSPNQMNQQIKRGQAPKEVERVDNPDPIYAKPHVHFKDGTSVTIDGEIHDEHNGTPKLSNNVLRWLHNNGWCMNLN